MRDKEKSSKSAEVEDVVRVLADKDIQEDVNVNLVFVFVVEDAEDERVHA